MAYHQLDIYQRESIEHYINLGYSQSYTACMLQVHRSTISNELKRNSVRGVYDARFAQELTDNRKTRPSGYIGRLYKVKPRIGYRLPYRSRSFFDREFRLFKSIQSWRSTREQAKRDRRFEFRFYEKPLGMPVKWYQPEGMRVRIRIQAYVYKPFRIRTKYPYMRMSAYTALFRRKRAAKPYRRYLSTSTVDQWKSTDEPGSRSTCPCQHPDSGWLTYEEICTQIEQMTKPKAGSVEQANKMMTEAWEKCAHTSLNEGVKTKIPPDVSRLLVF